MVVVNIIHSMIKHFNAQVYYNFLKNQRDICFSNENP